MDANKIFECFFPYDYKCTQKLYDDQIQLAHYTTAEALHNILKNGYVWLRNVSVMNDYSELRYGYDVFDKYFHNNYKNIFKYDVFIRDNESYLMRAWNEFKNDEELVSWYMNTHIMCFTEHNKDDNDGNIMFWQSYGKNGVAIVLKSDIFLSGKSVRGFCSIPVKYFTYARFEQYMNEFIQSVLIHENDISTMTDEDFLNTLKYFIRFSIVSMKHPGFDKEKEWRVFGHKNDINMAGLYSDIECIKGIIQPVFKLRFAITEKDEENCDIYLSQLLDKIIVGPTQHAYYATSKLAIAQALSQYYETAEDAISKIFISSIPYRVI